MSQAETSTEVFPTGTARYAVAELLVRHERATQQFLHDKIGVLSAAEIRTTLRDMYQAQLAKPSANDKRWHLTTCGLLHWRAQHMRSRGDAANSEWTAPAPAPLAPMASMSLLTRGMCRMASPADRLPMVYRDGALDFKKCARLDGPWRVFPDGTREPQDAKPTPRRLVTIPAREDHEGYSALTVSLPWKCIHCGGPRGEPVDAFSYDGSRRLNVHSWSNDCGHIEKYSEIRVWLQTEGGDA